MEENKNKNIEITTIVCGGLGNQLLMLFNLISLSNDTNKSFKVYYNEQYPDLYYKNNDVVRHLPNKYNMFKNINFEPSYNFDNKDFINYNEKSFSYNKIELEENKKYNLCGYFQSYKYFYHNKDKIKECLFIDNDNIEEIKNKLNSFNKKTIGIHVRLGDYIKKEDYHSIVPNKYYEHLLSKFDKNEYSIILFSDDLINAHKKLDYLKFDFIDAYTIYTDEEQQFLMFSLCDIKICSNSTYSLMSSFINDIYEFKINTKSFFYYKWFGITGPEYDINDIIPTKNNYAIINDEDIKCDVGIKKIKICLLVLTCDREEYKGNLEISKEKYLNDFKYDYFLIKARDDIDKPYLENNILYTNCDECYENLPKKMLIAYKYFYENFDYDFIIKIDDSCYINSDNLDKFIYNNFYNFHYLGRKVGGGNFNRKWHFGRCKNNIINETEDITEYIGTWCSGGNGYILSKYCVSILIKNNYNYLYNCIYEDKAFSDVLRKNNIFPSYEYNNELKISIFKFDENSKEYIFNSKYKTC